MFKYNAVVGLLMATALAVVSASPIFEEDELANLNPRGNLYRDFCMGQRKIVLKEIDQVSHKFPLAAVRGFYFVGDKVGNEEVAIEAEPSGKRSFAEAFAWAMGLDSPTAALILMSFQKRSNYERHDSSIMDDAVKANCEVFNKFAANMRAAFATVKSDLSADVELEQMGCKTVNRVLRMSHICDFAAEAVTKPKYNGVYVPNRLFI